MPSPSDGDPSAVARVVEQYHRRQRVASWLVVTGAVGAFLWTFAVASLVPAVGVAVVLVGCLRAPVLKSSGSVRLRTDADVATVVDAFEGPRPPVLAFQWAIADDVSMTDGSAAYRVSSLFGLQSATMNVDTGTETTPAGARRVELVVTVGDQPWGTYTATVQRDGGQTVVDVETESDRRFGLRRLPQQYYLKKYRDDALAAQGYTVVERD